MDRRTEEPTQESNSGAASPLPTSGVASLLVDRIIVRHLRMRLRTPFVTALGVEDERDIIITEVQGAGMVGYGEVPVMRQPVYNEETVTTAWHVLNDFFVPAVLAQPVRHPMDIPERLGAFRGHAMARAGLEGAFWDFWARQRGISLSAALGGTRARVGAGVALGFADDSDTLLRHIESYLQQGYQRIKVKIEPGRDVDVVRDVRRQFPEIDLAVDANGSYRMQRANDVKALQQLDQYCLSMIEQPLSWDDLIDHARLQSMIETPICLDESVRTREHAAHALELESCRMFNIKAARVGGLTEALAIHEPAQARDVPVWCGGMLESGIGRAHNVALASLPGFRLPGDLSASSRYWVDDIVDPPFALDDEGFIPVPTNPGIGVDVDVERLEALTVRVATHARTPSD